MEEGRGCKWREGVEGKKEGESQMEGGMKIPGGVSGGGSLTRKGVLAVGMWVRTLQASVLTAFSWFLYCWALSEVAQKGTGLAEKKGLNHTSGRGRGGGGPLTLEPEGKGWRYGVLRSGEVKIGAEEHLADDPVLLTVALPQSHHLSPQDLVLPGGRGGKMLRHLSLLRHHAPPNGEVTSRRDMYPTEVPELNPLSGWRL